MWIQMSAVFLKTLGLVYRIVRNGTMIGRMVTARLLTTVGVVEMTIALNLNRLAAKLVTLIRRLVSNL